MIKKLSIVFILILGIIFTVNVKVNAGMTDTIFYSVSVNQVASSLWQVTYTANYNVENTSLTLTIPETNYNGRDGILDNGVGVNAEAIIYYNDDVVATYDEFTVEMFYTTAPYTIDFSDFGYEASNKIEINYYLHIDNVSETLLSLLENEAVFRGSYVTGKAIFYDKDLNIYYQEIFIGSPTQPASNPATPEGYEFLYWVDNSGYRFYFDRNITEAQLNDDGELHLYPKYEEPFTVYFYNNLSLFHTGDYVVYADMPENIPISQAGYDFLFWTDDTGNEFNFDKRVLPEQLTEDRELYLYAKFDIPDVPYQVETTETLNNDIQNLMTAVGLNDTTGYVVVYAVISLVLLVVLSLIGIPPVALGITQVSLLGLFVYFGVIPMWIILLSAICIAILMLSRRRWNYE